MHTVFCAEVTIGEPRMDFWHVEEVPDNRKAFGPGRERSPLRTCPPTHDGEHIEDDGEQENAGKRRGYEGCWELHGAADSTYRRTWFYGEHLGLVRRLKRTERCLANKIGVP